MARFSVYLPLVSMFCAVSGFAHDPASTVKLVRGAAPGVKTIQIEGQAAQDLYAQLQVAEEEIMFPGGLNGLMKSGEGIDCTRFITGHDQTTGYSCEMDVGTKGIVRR